MEQRYRPSCKHLASISDEATAHPGGFVKDYEECVSNIGHLNHN